MAKTVETVLESAKRVLDNALQGEADFLDGGERRLSGLYNAVSSGRSVTFVIQNLRSVVPDFDDWYLPIQAGLRADPVARFFHDLRNQIEKEGNHGSTVMRAARIKLDTSDLEKMAPPGTTGFFFGDSLGRSGWHVGLPDGTETVVYFTPPKHMADINIAFEDGPDDRGIAAQLREWLATNEQTYLAAVNRFAPDNAALVEVPRHGHEAFDDKTLAALQAAIREAGFGPR